MYTVRVWFHITEQDHLDHKRCHFTFLFLSNLNCFQIFKHKRFLFCALRCIGKQHYAVQVHVHLKPEPVGVKHLS